MSGADGASAIAARYRRFADVHAAGRSPIYVEIAMYVSESPQALDFVAALPPAQPPSRGRPVHAGPLANIDEFADAPAEHAPDIAAILRTRTTQTNIPERCATLLPALALLPQPLALVEVGASAGLCLYPDRYAYDYDGHLVRPSAGGNPPLFRCKAGPGTPLPQHPVEVVWRAGLDLNPLDVDEPDDRAWLEALVWPGEEHLRDQLRAAVAVARADPPLLVRGDLVTDLAPLVARAPSAATVVVFHTAVLAYVRSADDRQRFADTVRASRATWLANESPAVIPGVSRDIVDAHPDGAMLLCQDGRPIARTDPHGSSVDWLGAC